MASAKQVARYLQRQHLFGAMQLQKLVYYAQAWALTWTGQPLFDEEIQAWEKGPVTRSVWEMGTLGDLDLDRSELAADERAIVDAVYAYYGGTGGRRLSDLTHTESPWMDTWDEGRGRNAVITHSAMRRAYSEKALLEPKRVPAAPVLHEIATEDEVKEAGETERRRWRTLLDRLAKQ